MRCWSTLAFALLASAAVAADDGGKGFAAKQPQQRELALPARFSCDTQPARTPLKQCLDDAAEIVPPAVRAALAGKPSPYIIKAHDVGLPTDFHTDIPWHLLDKEKDPRFPLPHGRKLGLFNTNSDVNWLIGLGLDGKPVQFNPPRRFTDHLVNLAAEEVDLGEVTATVLFLPVRSDTVLAVLELRNPSSQPHRVRVESACTRPPTDTAPMDRYGYGISVTTGKLQWIGWNAANGAIVSSLDEWDRSSRQARLAGSLLCTLLGSEPPTSHRTSIAGDDSAVSDAVLAYDLDVPAGGTRSLALALNLHRFGPERLETRMRVALYPAEAPEAALDYSVRTAAEALRSDWPALVRESYRWYERLPEFEFPRTSWAADVYCALELPRANTWSAQEQIRQPWYTFCRPHGHEPYGWWSYGMHGHEHLATFVTNLTEPLLSQSYIEGHLQVQKPDGEFPYGVNHRLENIRMHAGLATAPLIAHEAWTAYLWSGDRAFLQRAYDAGTRNVRWWRSSVRTRGGAPLQHWKDYIETVRDDGDLATWTATDKAENQEALDLNCYLLSEERALAAMARELGRGGEAQEWDAIAERRTAAMREHLWHAEDRVFYGRDIAGNRWARVLDISTFLPLWCGLATDAQARDIVRLLHDPTAFDTACPIATLAVRHMPERERGRWHWRGANWVEVTWLAIQGLSRCGFDDEAARLAEINCLMVFDTLEKTGHFREYYDSLTGEPCDLTDYIWTAMPAAMAVETFFGVRPTAEGIEILPAMPKDWPAISLKGLRVRGTMLNVTIGRDESAGSTRVSLNGKPGPVRKGRGAFIRWQDMPAECTVVIVQPQALPPLRPAE